MWLRLHARIVVMLTKFNQTNKACMKKFNRNIRACKANKMVNGILSNDHHKRKYYDAMDEWWH
jgi:hypothetical protein